LGGITALYISRAPFCVTTWLNAIGSRYFLDWLQRQHCSLAFTTYQTGKLFLVGRKSASGYSNQRIGTGAFDH
jgi:hypothetical protein